MAKKDREEAEVPELNVAETVSDPENTGTASTAPAGRRPRIHGRMAKPAYLIHHGKFEAEIPAVTRDVVITDEEDERFGEVVSEEVVPAYTVKGALPKDSRYGSRKIGVAHEVWDAAEAENLRARGFVNATDAEISKSEKQAKAKGINTNEIAQRERERALKQFKTFGGVARASDAARDNDE